MLYSATGISGADWGRCLKDCYPEFIEEDPKSPYMRIHGRNVPIQQIAIPLSEITSISLSILQNSSSQQDMVEVQGGLGAIAEKMSVIEDDTLANRIVPLIVELKIQQIEIRKEILFSLVYKEDELHQEELQLIHLIISESPYLLVSTNCKGHQLFPFMIRKCPRELMTELICFTLNNSEGIKDQDFNPVKQYIFNFGLYDLSVFQKMMRRPDANRIFDGLLRFLDPNELNRQIDWRDQILNFAFSSKRFEGIFIQDDDFSAPFLLQTTPFANAPEMFVSEEMAEKLLSLRMGSCDTLTRPTLTQAQSVQNWVRAQKFASLAAKSQVFSLDLMRSLNRMLTQNEPGVEYPGRTRDETEKIVRVGGAWGQVLCPPEKLKKQLLEFEQWMNNEMEKCDRGEKNPIIFAAQSYQRFITLHPFENGNGRTAKLLLDTILERYSLPPAILPQDFHAIGFNLQPINKDLDHVLENIIKGIQHSYYTINSS